MPRRRRRSPSRSSDCSAELGKRAKFAGSDAIVANREHPAEKSDGNKLLPTGAVTGLGDLAKLQQKIAEERQQAQLFVIKAKQAQEAEAWEHEYFKGTRGERCGPGDLYVLDGELGRGVFSTVFRCKDAMQHEFAIKFIRSNAMVKKAAEKEIALMRRLAKHASSDPEGSAHILEFAGCELFEHHGHLALVFPLMKCDLRTALAKYGRGYGLPLLPEVRNFGRNMFMALRFLSQIGIIHGDLKPDNLLMSLDKASVKLCDFGGAMHLDDRVHTDYLQPRYYRAPEVILGQAYNTQADVWSAGVTLFEIATDTILFENGSSNNEMIHEMLKVCGSFSQHFCSVGGFAHKHFDSAGNFLKPKTTSKYESNKQAVLPMSSFARRSRPTLHLLTEKLTTPPRGIDVKSFKIVLQRFAHLLDRCLLPDPDERYTPEAALADKFFAPFAVLVGSSS